MPTPSCCCCFGNCCRFAMALALVSLLLLLFLVLNVLHVLVGRRLPELALATLRGSAPGFEWSTTPWKLSPAPRLTGCSCPEGRACSSAAIDGHALLQCHNPCRIGPRALLLRLRKDKRSAGKSRERLSGHPVADDAIPQEHCETHQSGTTLAGVMPWRRCPQAVLHVRTGA